MKEVQKIKEAIKKWEQIKNTDIALNFLTSGIGFTITKEEYKLWLEVEQNADSIENIHLYIGIVEFETTFFLVDSTTDKAQNYKVGKNLFIKGFTNNLAGNPGDQIPDLQFSSPTSPNEINSEEAIKRLMKWYLYSQVWFKNNQANKKVLSKMVIPFKDLKTLFRISDTDKIFAFFALRFDSDYKEEVLELILVNEKKDKADSNASNSATVEHFADVTRPCPPFSATDFNL